MRARRRAIPMRHCAGFTMAEAVICILLVGVALVAALQTVGASARSRTITERRALGMMLAQDLLAEVLDHPYHDPGGLSVLGLEADELLTSRPNYDDVDDYDGYDESPPRDASNDIISGFTGWRRTVNIVRAPLSNLNGSSLTDTGAKRITVTVYDGNLKVAAVSAVRTEAWDQDLGGE